MTTGMTVSVTSVDSGTVVRIIVTSGPDVLLDIRRARSADAVTLSNVVADVIKEEMRRALSTL